MGWIGYGCNQSPVPNTIMFTEAYAEKREREREREQEFLQVQGHSVKEEGLWIEQETD